MQEGDAADAARSRRRDRWLALAVPVLVLAVALTQVTLAHTRELTPWRGGGFGMFSTVDGHYARFTRVWTEADAAPRPLDLDEIPAGSELASRLVDFQALPDTPRRRALEEALRASALAEDSDTFRIELWTLRYDPDTDRVTPRRIDPPPEAS